VLGEGWGGHGGTSNRELGENTGREEGVSGCRDILERPSKIKKRGYEDRRDRVGS